MRTLITAVIAVHGTASTGCSFLYTKGPHPELHPPPSCTTSNEAPIADTVLAAASVGVIVGGAIIANNTKNCGGFPCGAVNGLTGDGMIILGAIGTLIFIPSAGVGYSRTAACRGWLERNPEYASHPLSRARPPETSPKPLVAAQRCTSRGDAPLVCSSGSLRP